jgi:antitoxin (DNA-binding transcriptional repressor) of toxin-antitoxin stability system
MTFPWTPSQRLTNADRHSSCEARSFVYVFEAAAGLAVDVFVKHVIFRGMKTITIRDLRQRWPEAEAALQVEDEIIITRDSKPVAKLVRVAPAETQRPRWTPEAHRRWIKKVFGKKVFPSSDEPLAAARADRRLT